ncbi:GNAT family N-acetyltransferase [Paenibacillus ehimensis]|uniref:GNAT family N-acetyltransferase n=1 Tax=Paenibacillus ehimensis TaxID=79264 RepID=A0ABT8VE49_9BACL|nr:GNAT family N-acetyltransferase [Paenibacillus ehimensis]MDO3679257.1 GNAT family N-acetyltransferase [Paenibacillus ehimensis]MEC0213359.1 GNAT family N-acetyltransferase [Paenibacillus ehimensis]
MRYDTYETKEQVAQLRFYRREHDAALRAFELPEEQAKFTALPDEVLEASLNDENQYPVVILAGDTPVGFFILHRSETTASLSDNPNAILLRAFSVNHAEQGRGYAKRGMQNVAAFVAEHLPGVEEIVLAVNERNLAAKRLYEAVGFRDTGRKRQGPIGMQHILSLSLEQ